MSSAGSIAGRTLAALLALSGVAHARVFEEARVAAPFLKIGQGARASGMGEAFTAIADDSTAVFWNPAGLAQLTRFQVQFTHNEWVEDFRHEYFGLAGPWEGGWAVAYSILDLGEFAELDDANVATGNTFTVNDQLVQLGYGRAFFDQTLLVGAGVKLVREDLGDGIRGTTASFDLGVIGVPLWEEPRITLAAVVENIGGELAGFGLPLTARAGIAWRRSGLFAASAGYGPEGERAIEGVRGTAPYPWEADAVSDGLTLAADVVAPQRGRVEIHAGIEYWLAFAAARAGYRFRYPRNDLGGASGATVGLGLRGHGFQFDYGFDASFAPYGDLGAASRFSVVVSF